MAKTRSPNYPLIGFSEAIEAIRKVFKAEHRNKMSRLVLARHIGHASLNGLALGKIGAIRSYGLIEGSGDELRVSEDAITILTAPANSPYRIVALKNCAIRPSLFGELRAKFPDSSPSMENLRFELIRLHFTEQAAKKAAESYLATMDFLSKEGVVQSTRFRPTGPKDYEDMEEEMIEAQIEPTAMQRPKAGQPERVIFTEEESPQQRLKLIAAGELNEYLLDALENFVERQRRRLGMTQKKKAKGGRILI